MMMMRVRKVYKGREKREKKEGRECREMERKGPTYSQSVYVARVFIIMAVKWQHQQFDLKWSLSKSMYPVCLY